MLLRSPYRRSGAASPSLFALPYARRGYAVVLQSVRGTFGSGGEFTPVVNEEHDGQDTVGWLREQPWFDGRLATLGPSYLGYTQWALALDPPPELAAMVLHIGPHDLAAAGLLDGAFQLQNVATWTELIAHQELLGPVRGTARLLTAERRLAPHLRRLPLRGLPERFGGNPGAVVRRVARPPRPGRPLLGPLPRHPGRALLDRARRCWSAAGRTGSSSRRCTSTPSSATAASTSVSRSARGRTWASTRR